MSYQPPPGYPPQGYGPSPSGYGPPHQVGPYGMPPQAPPPKRGMSAAAIILIILGIMVVLGGGSCAMCLCIAGQGAHDAKVADDDAKAKAMSVNISTLLASYKSNEV